MIKLMHKISNWKFSRRTRKEAEELSIRLAEDIEAHPRTSLKDIRERLGIDERDSHQSLVLYRALQILNDDAILSIIPPEDENGDIIDDSLYSICDN